jgi:hypothetical protein
MLGLAALLAVVPALARSQETKLPEAVRKTFEARFPRAQIEKIDAEDENGVTVYDVEFRQGRVEKETDIAADGTLLEFTIVVRPEVVPADAMAAIRKAARGAKIKRLECVQISHETKDGKVVKRPKPITQYAAEMTKDDRTAEVVVNPDGSIVEEPKWGGAGETEKK